MAIEITWTITAIIAVSSFISPIFVAIINNKHQIKMRRLELEHDEYMRQLDLQQQTMVRQFDIYYADKKSCFSQFFTCCWCIFYGGRKIPVIMQICNLPYK